MQRYKPAKTPFHAATKTQLTRNPLTRLLAVEIEVARAQGSGDERHSRNSYDNDDEDHPGYDSDADCNCRLCMDQRACAEDMTADTATGRAVRTWGASIVDDGSLGDEGFEIPTAPASGDRFVEQIEAICTALRVDDASVSSYCGCHVHVDARDVTWFDLRRVLLVYGHVEKALFALVPQSRRVNSYCKPCGPQYVRMVADARGPGMGHAFKAGVQRQMYDFRSEVNPAPDYYSAEDRKRVHADRARHVGQNWKNLKQAKYAECRYNALNIHSWLYRGTLELRLPSGTVQATKIIAWARLFGHLVDYAVKMPEGVIVNASKGLSGYQYLLEILPADLHHFVTSRTRRFASSLSEDN